MPLWLGSSINHLLHLDRIQYLVAYPELRSSTLKLCCFYPESRYKITLNNGSLCCCVFYGPYSRVLEVGEFSVSYWSLHERKAFTRQTSSLNSEMSNDDNKIVISFYTKQCNFSSLCIYISTLLIALQNLFISPLLKFYLQILTKDSVTVFVNAIMYYKVKVNFYENTFKISIE